MKKSTLLDPLDDSLRDEGIRKSVFRETAGDILWKERDSRTYGKSFDTVSSIVMALEHAYSLGQSHSANLPEVETIKQSVQDLPEPWITIPKRAREAFSDICNSNYLVLFHKNGAPWKVKSDQWNCYRDLGDKFVGKERYCFECAYSVSTLAPLVKLGLMSMEKPNDELTMLELTEKGKLTFQLAVKKGQTYSL